MSFRTGQNRMPTICDIRDIHRGFTERFEPESFTLVGSAGKAVVTNSGLDSCATVLTNAITNPQSLEKLSIARPPRPAVFQRCVKDLDYMVPTSVGEEVLQKPREFGLELIRDNPVGGTAVFITDSRIEVDFEYGSRVSTGSLPVRSSFVRQQTMPMEIEPGLTVLIPKPFVQIMRKWSAWIARGCHEGERDAFDALYLVSKIFGNETGFLKSQSREIAAYLYEACNTTTKDFNTTFGLMTRAAEVRINQILTQIYLSKLEYQNRAFRARLKNPFMRASERETIMGGFTRLLDPMNDAGQALIEQKQELRQIHEKAHGLFVLMRGENAAR